MKASPLLPLAALFVASLASSLLAQTSATSGVPRHDTTIVTLGHGFLPNPQTPIPPTFVNVAPGSELHLKTGYDESAIVSIEWFKNYERLPSTSKTLSFSRAAESDSGRYFAQIVHAQGTLMTNSILVRVASPVRQSLLALSTRATISPSSPILIGGFVVARSPSGLSEGKTFLVRAVGPSLSTQGVTQPLPAPRLKVFDHHGTEIRNDLPDGAIPVWPGQHRPDFVAARVGAFPLLPNAADAAIVLTLASGIYSFHVSSADGASGDVLLEIYDVPDESLLIALPPPVPPSPSAGSAAPTEALTPPVIVDLPPVHPSGSF